MLMDLEIMLRFVVNQQIETSMKKVKCHRWDDTIDDNFEDFVIGVLNDYEYESHLIFFSSLGGSLITMSRIRALVNNSPEGRIKIIFSGEQASASTELLFSLKKDRVRIISEYLTMELHLYGKSIRYTIKGYTHECEKRDISDIDHEWNIFEKFWKDRGLSSESIKKIKTGKDVCLTNTECVDLCKENGILEYGKD